MEELVQLYAMLAHGGRFRPLRYLLEGKDVAGTRLLSPEAAALTLAMLEEAERPNQSYQLDWVRDEVPVSWKTGTSYGFRDAWTVGVVGPYVLAVWVGNFDARGNPAFVGRRAAAPLFFALVDALRPEVRAASTARHAGKVRQVQVCATSGQLPTEYCPRTESVGFIPGVSPIQRCTVHRQVHIDIASGLRACPGETDGTRAVVMEFWPSDLLRLFARAGLPRAEIPPYASRCGFAGRSQAGVPPRITSPQEEVVYELRASQLGEETIPLVAVADADVRELRWFIGARLVGRTARDEPLLWRAEPGKQVVRVVDDSGRADALSVRVSVVE